MVPHLMDGWVAWQSIEAHVRYEAVHLIRQIAGQVGCC